MHQIEVSDIKVDIVRKHIKNMHLSVYPPMGRVRIAVPLNIDDEAVRLFTISKLAWIRRQQRKFEQQDRQAERIYEERESHYVEGQRYLLRVTMQEGIPKVILKSKTYLDLYVRANTSTEQRQNLITEWYRQRLKTQIPPLLEKWESIIGVKADDWGVKQMKTKWGTCNIEKKRIWINLELAKKPLHCLEYIIVHELVHLLERHHNDRFLAFMDTYMPQWQFYREELNKLPVSHGEWTY